MGIALLPVWRPLDPALGAPQGVVGLAPPGITAALRGLARPGDRLFDPQPWGSWFEFALPTLPVAIDSRIELFPTSVWDTYDSIVQRPGVGCSAGMGALISSLHTRTRRSRPGSRRWLWHSAFGAATGTPLPRAGTGRRARYQRSA